MGIFGKIARGIGGGLKFVGKEVKNSIIGGVKSFGKNVLGSEAVGTIESGISEIKSSVRSDAKSKVGRKENKEPKKPEPTVNEATNTNDKPVVISYKDLPPTYLSGDNKEVLKEWERHNKEIEDILRKDSENRNSIEKEKLELYKKEYEEYKRDKDKLEREERDAKISESSKGKLEESGKDSESSEETEQSNKKGGGILNFLLSLFPLLLGRIGKFFKNKLFSPISKLFGNITKGFKGLFSKVFLGLKKFGVSILGGFKKVGKLLISGFSKILSPLKSLISNVGGLINKVASPIVESIKSGVGKTVTKVKDVAKNVGSKVAKSGVGKAVTKVKDVAKNVGKAVTKVKDVAKNIGSKVAKSGVGKAVTKVKDVAKNIGSKVAKSGVGKAAKFLAKPKALVKVGKKMLSKILPSLPKLAKTAGVAIAKGGSKTALKQVPLLGIALGVGEAIKDAVKGDWLGAILAALSGIAPTLNLVLPGVGTAISMGAIGADIAREVLKKPAEDAANVWKEADPDTIMDEPDIDLSESIRQSDIDEATEDLGPIDSENTTNITESPVSTSNEFNINTDYVTPGSSDTFNNNVSTPSVIYGGNTNTEPKTKVDVNVPEAEIPDGIDNEPGDNKINLYEADRTTQEIRYPEKVTDAKNVDFERLPAPDSVKFQNFVDDFHRIYPKLKMVVTSGYRNDAVQNKLRMEGGVVAKTRSRHQDGAAIDINIFDKETGAPLLKKMTNTRDWIDSGIPTLAAKHGLWWYGFHGPGDSVHFEIPNQARKDKLSVVSREASKDLLVPIKWSNPTKAERVTPEIIGGRSQMPKLTSVPDIPTAEAEVMSPTLGTPQTPSISTNIKESTAYNSSNTGDKSPIIINNSNDSKIPTPEVPNIIQEGSKTTINNIINKGDSLNNEVFI